MQRGFSVMLIILELAARASAQPGGSNAIAEQLFNQARELAKANRWAEACPKFEASLHYDPVLGTRLNLATCYEHTGRLASAWGLYREAMQLAKKTGDRKRHDYAQKQAESLEPRLARLSISAPPSPPSGLTIIRDGTPVDTGSLDIPLYVDAGPHEIKAAAPGFENFTQTITVVDGRTESLTIPELKTVPSATPESEKPSEQPEVQGHQKQVTEAVPARPATPSPAPARSRTRAYLAIGIGATGTVVAGVGALFGAKASSSYSDAKTLCSSKLICETPADYEQGKQFVRDARSNATISTVLVAAGGAAVIAGVIVFLTAPGQAERTATAIVPTLDSRGAGLSVSGAF